jgi:hypothetical protein
MCGSSGLCGRCDVGWFRGGKDGGGGLERGLGNEALIITTRTVAMAMIMIMMMMMMTLAMIMTLAMAIEG